MNRPRHRSTAGAPTAYSCRVGWPASYAGSPIRARPPEGIGTEPEPIEPSIHLRSPRVERLAHGIHVSLVQLEHLDQARPQLIVGACAPALDRRALMVPDALDALDAVDDAGPAAVFTARTEPRRQRQMRDLDHALGGERHGRRQHLLQLADVQRPAVP